MSFKEWPYWKKGGIIGFNLCSIVFLLRWTLYTFFGDIWFSYIFKIILIVISLPIDLIIFRFLSLFGNNLVGLWSSLIFELILTFSWWYLLGTIIGRIYEKLKKN